MLCHVCSRDYKSEKLNWLPTLFFILDSVWESENDRLPNKYVVLAINLTLKLYVGYIIFWN